MPRAARALATVLAALATACATAPAPASHRTRLVLEGTSMGFQPLVRATVAGEPVTLLVDTGAPRSVLPEAFVRAHGLRRWPAATDVEMVDANGKAARMSVLPGVPLQFEGESTPLALDFLMNPGANAGPILAPQDLLGRGWAIVIDLGGGELRYEPEGDALKRLRERGSPLRELRYSGCRGRTHRVVRATVNGVPSDMLIDTGSESTTLARNHPALRSMESTLGQPGAALGVSSRGKALIVDQVPIGFAEASYVLPAMVLPVSGDCWKGAIGADLLRHCTLVWGWSSLWAACQAP